MDSLEVINEKYNNMLECATNRYLYEIETVSYFYDASIIPVGQIVENMMKETKTVEQKQRVQEYQYFTLISDEIMTFNVTVPKYNKQEIIVEIKKFINKYELEEFERITKYDFLKEMGYYIANNITIVGVLPFCYFKNKYYFINIVKDRQIARLKPIKKYLQRQQRLYKKQIETLNNNLL